MGSPELVTAGFALNKAWLDPKNLKLSGSRNEHLRVLIRMLENRQGLSRSVAQCLLGKPVPVSDPVGSMRSLVAEIHAESPKDAEEIILAVLARMVNYWNFANDTQSRNSSNQASGVQVSSLPQPEIPVRMPRPEPPFTPRRWAGLKKYKDWSDAVLVDIESSAPKAWSRDPRNLDADARRENISYRIARVLASAVLWGGLLCREHLEAFYLSLSMWPNTSEFIAGRVYLTWVDEINNCRRWLPEDLLVLLLLSRCKTQFLMELTVGWRGVIDSFFTVDVIRHSKSWTRTRMKPRHLTKKTSELTPRAEQ